MTWEWFLLIAAAMALCAGCLLPNSWLPARLPNDKLMHFLAYAGLTGLALRIAHGRAEAITWVVGLLLAGCLIECLQQLVPERSFSWSDIAANAAGVACATTCALGYTTWAYLL